VTTAYSSAGSGAGGYTKLVGGCEDAAEGTHMFFCSTWLRVDAF